MIKSLKFSVTFPSTGKTFTGDHTFAEGLTAITGANEAGKSLRLEMIRYALFGTAALRGKGEHYKGLKVELEFEANGKLLVVVRQGNKATISHAAEVLAVSTKAVNARVVQELGFGLPVFDVACACTQGEIERLGSMLPAERKRLVDSTIGLGALDELARWCHEQQVTANATADALEKGLVRPNPIEPPENYRPSNVIESALVEAKSLERELMQIEAQLANPVAEPTPPEEPVLSAPIEEIREKVWRRQELLTRLREAQAALAGIPKSVHTDEDLARLEAEIEAYEKWRIRQDFLRDRPQPTVSKQQIDQMKQDAHLCDRFEARDRLLALWEKLKKQGDHTCPACSHQWPVAVNDLKKVEAQLAAFDDLNGKTKPDRPNAAFVQLMEVRLATWNDAAPVWEHLKDIPEVPKPSVSAQRLQELKDLQSKQAMRGDIEKLVDGLQAQINSEKDHTAEVHAWDVYESLKREYAKRLEVYNAWLEVKAELAARAAALVLVPKTVEQLEAAKLAALLYEQELKAYDRELAAFNQRSQEHAAAKEMARQWGLAKQALGLLRLKVKQHLLPSLNRVASFLLAQMTAGRRRSIVVNDDWEVTVDGQDLVTLSGSGKACVNLALRIALGQVLTARMLPIFLADEIDAAMDEERAGATAECLKGLTKVIKQILLVSHKRPDADHYLEVKAA